MGNRHHIEVFTPRILNPREHPGLHYTWDEERKCHEYTPNVSGMEIRFAIGTVTPSDAHGYTVRDIESKYSIKIPLMPAIGEQPPIECVTDERAREVVSEHRDAVLSGIVGKVNVIVCKHGRGWGLFPESAIAQVLRRAGCEVPQVFPKVGGRNRIQEHAVIILPQNRWLNPTPKR